MATPRAPARAVRPQNPARCCQPRRGQNWIIERCAPCAGPRPSRADRGGDSAPSARTCRTAALRRSRAISGWCARSGKGSRRPLPRKGTSASCPMRVDYFRLDGRTLGITATTSAFHSRSTRPGSSYTQPTVHYSPRWAAMNAVCGRSSHSTKSPCHPPNGGRGDFGRLLRCGD